MVDSMKKLLVAIVAFTVGTFIFPSLFVGFAHGDIGYIATARSWSEIDRFAFELIALISGAASALVAVHLIDFGDDLEIHKEKK